MLKAAIGKLIELAPITTHTLLNRLYSDRALVAVREPETKALEGHTLSGIKSFLESEKVEKPVIHIAGFNFINLLSSLFGPWKQREVFFSAQAYPVAFAFNSWLDLESMIISLQSCFVQTDTTRVLLAIIGNLTDGVIKTYQDDGITQSATIKVGITRKDEAAVPNPVLLAPYRTFPEVEQPESRFVFRLQPVSGGTPRCGLFEADGGAWKNACVANIRAWLEANIPGIPIIG